MFCHFARRHCLSLLPTILLAAAPAVFGQLLYVGNTGDDTISTYVIDQDTGLLTELFPRIISSGSPSSVVAHPNGKFLFATNFGNANLGANGPSIAVLSINGGTGGLKLLTSTALPSGSAPQGATLDPSGKFLLFANQNANTVSVYTIDAATGALTQVPGSPFAAPGAPNNVVVHPSGKFAYATANSTGQIDAFNLDANGALTPIAGSPFAARANFFGAAIDPAGKFLFAVERQDNAVLAYSINVATGALTQVGPPTPAGGGVSGLSVDSAGKFVYVSNFGIGAVTVLSIGTNGALTQIPRGTFPAINGAYSAVLAPDGKFLYVPGQSANAVAAFAVDTNTGGLTPLPQQFFPSGNAPQRAATVLLSPPVIPPILVDSAANLFSIAPPGMPNAGIAQGSRFAIAGKNIGPATTVNASLDSRLQFDLGGVSVQIHAGDATIPAIVTSAASNLVTAVLPSNTPLGDATINLTYKNRTTTPLPITVVTAAVGIRTLNNNGNGPARAWNATPDLSPTTDLNTVPSNSITQSARPGQFVVVQATGLGAVTRDENDPSIQPLAIPADVIVGNEVVQPFAEIRAAGVDFIAFQLPADVTEGCYVPLAVRTGGVTSNVASISISSTGPSCSDPAGLSVSDIDLAQTSGQLNMGVLVLSHLDLGPIGIQDGLVASFGRYNLANLQRTFAPDNPGNGIRGAFGLPPLGTCAATPGVPTKPDNLFDIPGDPILPQFLNAGVALNLSGPAGSVQIPAPNYEFEPNRPFVTPGDYTIDNGPGSPAIGSFKATFTLPPAIQWTNQDPVENVDRTQDFPVTWSGGVPDKEIAVILGLSVSNQATAGFLCTERISAGQFTIPAWVLSKLPKSDFFGNPARPAPGGLLGIGTVPLTSIGRFSATGLDFGVFTYEQAVVNLALFQ